MLTLTREGEMADAHASPDETGMMRRRGGWPAHRADFGFGGLSRRMRSIMAAKRP